MNIETRLKKLEAEKQSTEHTMVTQAEVAKAVIARLLDSGWEESEVLAFAAERYPEVSTEIN